VTSTVPIDPTGEVTVSVVAVLDKIVAEVAPNLTEVGLARLVPITVTRWAPVVGPELAMTAVTVGGDDAKAGGAPIHNIAVPVTSARTTAASLVAQALLSGPCRSDARRPLDRRRLSRLGSSLAEALAAATCVI
jgi:hypothetical protein